MYQIAIVGDPHINSNVSSRVDDYFESILSKIHEISTQCKNIIFLGDVFENPTLPLQYFRRLYEFFNTLKSNYGTNFYSIMGNHDLYHEDEISLDRTVLGLCGLTGIIKILDYQDSLQIDGYTFKTAPVNPEKCKKFLKEQEYNEDDILLLHQYYEEFDGLQYEDIQNLKCKRIFLGHQHNPFPEGRKVFENTALYLGGSLGRNRADEYNLHRNIFYYILDNNEIQMATIECMQPAKDVFTNDAFNQTNLKKKQFLKNINEVVNLYSNNISTQNKFSLGIVLQELHTPDKCFQYIRGIYSRINCKFD